MSFQIFRRSLPKTTSKLSLSRYQRLLSLSQYQRLLKLSQCQFYTFKKLAPVVCLSSKEKIRIKVAFETLSHKCRRDSHFQCNLFRSWRKWKRDNLRTKWSSWQRITIPLSNSPTAILRISPQTNSSVFFSWITSFHEASSKRCDGQTHLGANTVMTHFQICKLLFSVYIAAFEFAHLTTALTAQKEKMK